MADYTNLLPPLQFDIPTLIETASLGITLQPGDIIATGTPGKSAIVILSACFTSVSNDFCVYQAGVGIGRQPPIFLKPGDTVEVEIGNLGILKNQVDSSGGSPPACEPVRRSAVQYA